MTIRNRRTPLLLLLLLLAACGSGGGDLTGAIAPATTPEIAVRNLALATRDGGRDAYLGGLVTTPEQMDCLEGAYDVMEEIRRLRAAATAEWGEAGWKTLSEEPGAEWTIYYLKDEDLARLEVDVRGDRATATIPGQEGPLTLLLRDGVWKIDASAGAPTGDLVGAERPGERLREMARVLREARARIGEAGLTAEDLDREIAGNLFSGLGPENRYVTTTRPLVIVGALALLALSGCGPAAAPPPDEPGEAGAFRFAVEGSPVPLYVTVRATGDPVAPGPGSPRLVPVELHLLWEDGTDAAEPHPGSLAVARESEVVFHLPLPPVVDLDFEYVAARVTPRVDAEGRIGFEVATQTYACIR